ncbi:MAG: hypothetical protein K6F99_06885 [Lachnospiraceae bacterium]|nr:hypothetical protein [Lachnospiraceae bacterium]
MAISEYKCPACGGTMEFNPKTQNLKCPFCDTEMGLEEYKKQAGTDASADEKSSAKQPANPDEEIEGYNIYSCESCGGEIIAEEITGTATCPFCGNNIVVKEKFTGKNRPDYVLPFKFTQKEAKTKYKEYIRSKLKFLPNAFIDENHIDQIRGLYIPFWLYSADVTGEGSYKGDKIKTWKEGNVEFTETSHFDVTRKGNFSFSNIPVDASKEMPDDIMDTLEPFDLSEIKEFDMMYLAGFIANKYDVSDEEAYPRAEKRITNSTHAMLSDTLSSYNSTNTVFENIDIDKKKPDYALFPIWFLNTTWNGTQYLFAMNGQTGEFVGNLPCDKNKVTRYGVIVSLISIVLIYIVTSIFVGM